MLDQLLGVETSRGAIATIRERLSACLQHPAAEALELARQQPVAYVDETGAQVESDKPPERPEPPGLAVRLESAERFVAATGAVIVHGGDRAYYRPREDRIQLPQPEQFRSSEGYYATALHELTHWSGHKSRLDRDLTGRFGMARRPMPPKSWWRRSGRPSCASRPG